MGKVQLRGLRLTFVNLYQQSNGDLTPLLRCDKIEPELKLIKIREELV